MRNYQYTPEEEAQMDAFANEWKKTNRGIKGPSAWREFKQKHPWAKRITADGLRQKYTRLKRDQYWRAFAVTHGNCPRGHAICLANPPYIAGNFTALQNDIENYISASTQSIAPSAALPGFVPTNLPDAVSAPATVVESIPASVAESIPATAVSSSPATVVESVATTTTSSKSVLPEVPSDSSSVASVPNARVNSEDVVVDEISVDLPPMTDASAPADSKPTNKMIAPKACVNPEDVVVDEISVQLPPMTDASAPADSKPTDKMIAPKAEAEEGNASVISRNHEAVGPENKEDIAEDKASSQRDGDRTRVEKLETAVEKSDAEELIERVLQILDGLVVAELVDGLLVFVPANKAGGIQSFSLRQLLEQAKRVLLSYLEVEIKEFEENFSALYGPEKLDVLVQVHNQLKSGLTVEFDQLSGRLLAIHCN